MAGKNNDPLVPWFLACEDLREFIGVRFGRIPPGKTEPEWTFIRHAECDGIGGLAAILRQRGVQLDRLPHAKHPAPPSLLSLLRLLPKMLAPKERVEWGNISRGEVLENPAQPPPAVAWHVFDERTTLAIHRVCRKHSVTVNSFLLKHLARSVRPFLEDESTMVPWMVPVNLRGKVSTGLDTGNHSSYIGVKLQSYDTLQDVHRKIYSALGRSEQWANWYAYALGRFTTAAMRRFLIKHELAMSQWNIGSFSNLGDWDEEKKITQPDCLGSWVFAPPVLRAQMVGSGCVTFQNRMGLLIQFHPDLTTDPSVPREWVRSWVKEIEIDVDGNMDAD